MASSLNLVPSAAPGTTFNITVIALTPAGQADGTYRGTVHFTSSDASATLPADYAFTAADGGLHTFTGITLQTGGSQTVTAVDRGSAGIDGELAVQVVGAAPTPPTPSPSPSPSPSPAPGPAPDYYVSPAGNDGSAGTQSAPWKTLNASVKKLKPGNTLCLRAGTYNESLLDVIPSGTSSSPITLTAYPGEAPVIKTPKNGTAAIYLVGRSYINFTGLTVDGTNLANQAGVPIVWLGANTSHTTWDSCILQGNDGSNSQNFFLGSGSSDAAGSNHVQFNVFKNCTVGGNVHESGSSLSHGWYLEGSDNTIDGCIFHDISADGVQTYSGSGATPSRNTVKNCTFTNVGKLGASGLRPALQLYMGDSNVAYNNVVNGCGWGATLGGSNGALYNNTIYNSSAQGIQFNSPSGATVKNNIVAGMNGSIGSGGTQSNNWTGSMGDPKFVNPGAGDFHLQAGSPCIDKGATVALVTTDCEGTPRPQGAGYDIGAYEYH